MIDAIKSTQRADLLQLALSPRRGRKAPGADPGQVASGRAGGPDFGALAEGDDARGLFIGVTPEGMGGVGPKTQGDAFRRRESRSVAEAAGKKIRSGHPGQGRADLGSG